MASYVLTIVSYPAADNIGTFEWGIAGAKGQLLAAGRGTITGSGTTTPLVVERLTYHALLAGLQALLAEDYAGALIIAAAPAFIALLRPGNHAEDHDLQRLRQQAIQLLALQAVVLRWHLRGLNLDLALRKAALSAQIEARKSDCSNPA